MRTGLGLATGGAVLVAALAGCGLGGSSPTAATLSPEQAVTTAASVQAQPSVAATLTWAQRDCEVAVAAVNDVAAPVEQQDAAGVVSAGQTAQAGVSVVDESVLDSTGVQEGLTNVVGAATDVLAEVEAMAAEAAQFEDGYGSWLNVTDQEPQLATYFKSLQSACSAAGVAIQ